MLDIEIVDCEQGSDEWHRARLGIPTASRFKDVLAKGQGKVRRSYMCQLAAEIITGEPLENFTSLAMDRGKALEQEVRDHYAFVNNIELQRVGFIKGSGCGCSPDALVGDDGVLEIKTQRGDLLIETLLRDDIPPEHKAQVQGSLLVTGRDWCDLVVYWPRMPVAKFRCYRDQAFIPRLWAEITRFNDELNDLVQTIRNPRRGGYNTN